MLKTQKLKTLGFDEEQLIENIDKSLKRANRLAIAKELYAIGEMSKEYYKKYLLEVVRD